MGASDDGMQCEGETRRSDDSPRGSIVNAMHVTEERPQDGFLYLLFVQSLRIGEGRCWSTK